MLIRPKANLCVKFNMASSNKGPRSVNWNSNEKNVLLGLIIEVIDKIENKKTDFNANNAKHQAWQKVLSGFSAAFGNTRELKELKDQWKRTKQVAKKEWQGKKDHVRGTGGGPPAPQISATTSTVMALCPRDFVSIKSQYDDDADTSSIGTVSANDSCMQVCNTRNHQVLPYHFQHGCIRVTRIQFC